MLPSQGYFKGIDCPFYASDLCHRFYCHFRHTKREPISFTTEITKEKGKSNLVNDDLPQSISDVKILTKSCNLNQEEITIDGKTTQTLNNRIYLPPDNIPSYNPTPISELQTRGKHVICENVEHLTKCSYNSETVKETKSKESVNCCSDLAKDLVSYFLESDTLYEIVSNKINEISKYSAKSRLESNTNKPMITHKNPQDFINEPNFPLEDNNTEHFKENNINLNIKNDLNQTVHEGEHLGIKEKILILPEKQSLIDPDPYRKKSEVEEIVNQKNESKSLLITNKNYKVCKTSKSSKKNSSKECSGQHKKRSKHKHSKSKTKETSPEFIKNTKVSQNQHESINNNFQNQPTELNQAKSDNQKEDFITIPDSDSEIYDEFDEILKNIQEIKTLNQENKDPLKTKKTMESEKYDEFDEIVKSVEEIKNKHITVVSPELKNTFTEDSKYDELDEIKRTMQETFENLPEPKKKLRISHVKTNYTNSYPQKCSSSETENDFPQAKKKIRIAHAKAERNTITIKSTKEYISHWDRVKERVKNKCINPSGEEGYQNWSKVKISPVLNVSSLLKSKKLLYAKINQWNSGKK